MKKIVTLGISFFIVALLHAQTDKYSSVNWQLKDFNKDSIYGASVTKAYDELLKGKPSHTVIVAVIDAGIDTAHEDLQGYIWTNRKEIPGNGIDDDHNGYIDDIHGWNFLGGKDGSFIEKESVEAFREYYRLFPVYATMTDSTAVPASKKEEYNYWLMLKKKHVADSSKLVGNIKGISSILLLLKPADSAWEMQLHKDSVSITDIKTAIAAGTASAFADSIGKKVIDLYTMRHLPNDLKLEFLYNLGITSVNNQKAQIAAYADDPNAARKAIVGDDLTNINDSHYGNPNVDAGTPTHGTHVAGIIAATRNNGIGMDGIDDNVLIMPIRAIPDGDERDKDVALAIRYAADNGAQIINMSFGKPFSPNKEWVDDAVKYAEKKDVLIVHAAMNDAQDLDTVKGFPSPEYIHGGGKAANFITVGANAGGPDSSLAASFSNYGAKEVDLFAPGVKVYSTVPGSKYAFLSGTSMATPVVCGVAALVLEYYPKLSAKQVKYVLEHSVSTFPDDVVKVPGTLAKAKFSTLSRTGGIVNAFEALKLAATLKGDRK